MKTIFTKAIGSPYLFAARTWVAGLPGADSLLAPALAVGVVLFAIIYGLAAVPFLLILIFFGITLVITSAALLQYVGLSRWYAAAVAALVLPFTGLFNAVDKLPNVLQVVAHFLPPTYIFDGLRTVMEYNAFSPRLFIAAAILSGVYFFFAYLFVGREHFAFGATLLEWMMWRANHR